MPTPTEQLESFIAAYDPAVAAVARAALTKRRIRYRGANVLIYDNYNALAIGFSATDRSTNAVFSLALYPRYVSLFFLVGPDLPDPHKRLKGAGKVARHIVLQSAADLDDPAVRRLMKAALARAAAPFDLRSKGKVIIKSISANQRPRRPPTKTNKRKALKPQRPTTSPFRWTISRREQLGGLVEGLHNRPPLDAGFVSFLRNAAACVLALSKGADLAFVGRTLENFFDYLSGAFSELKDAPHLHLVQFSLRWTERGGVKALPPKKVAALFEYLTEEGVDAAAIARARRPLALVDFVAYGGTMESFVRLLHLQAGRNGVDWNAVQRRLRIIGLRARTKNSPNTWRWQQHQNWLDLIPDADIKNASAEREYLFHIANTQPKVTESFHLGRWDEPQNGAPEPDVLTRHAIAMAADLFDLGRSRQERTALAARLARSPQMRQPATRALALKLRRG